MHLKDIFYTVISIKLDCIINGVEVICLLMIIYNRINSSVDRASTFGAECYQMCQNGISNSLADTRIKRHVLTQIEYGR